jgi:hypothetical protein
VKINDFILEYQEKKNDEMVKIKRTNDINQRRTDNTMVKIKRTNNDLQNTTQ